MSQIQQILESWGRLCRVGKVDLRGFLDSVKWKISGAQGGEWTFAPGAESVLRNDDSSATGEIHISQEDFLELAARRLNPQRAFLSGRIRLHGDREVLLRFSRVLEQLIDLSLSDDSHH